MGKGMNWAFATATLALAGIAAREFTANPQALPAPAPTAAEAFHDVQTPALAGSANMAGTAKRSQDIAITVPATTPATTRERTYASLNRRFPGGLQTEAEQALRAANGARALEVAREIGTCLSWADLREAMERNGKQELLAVKYPEMKSDEQPRIDAFCQTAGPNADELSKSLMLLAAQQGIRDAVYWAHELQQDPSGTSSRLIGRWAMEGADLRAVGQVIYGQHPEVFGLRMDDQNVARRAIVLLSQTPEYANESSVERMIQMGQEAANYQRAGVSSGQAYEALPNKPQSIKFAELALPPADEQRARDIVKGLIDARRRRLAAAGG